MEKENERDKAVIPFLDHLGNKFGFDWRQELFAFNPANTIARDIFLCKAIAENLIKEVSKICAIPVFMIKSKTRKRETTCVRYLCQHLIMQHQLLSLAKCGELFSGRDHSTVIHAISNVEDYIVTNDRVFMPYYNACKHLYSQETLLGITSPTEQPEHQQLAS